MTRNRRCSRCGKLKPPNPAHSKMCVECVPLYQAEMRADFHAKYHQRDAEIRARTSAQNLALAKESMETARPISAYDIDLPDIHTYDCRITVDADVLHWLIDQYELLALRRQTITECREKDRHQRTRTV